VTEKNEIFILNGGTKMRKGDPREGKTVVHNDLDHGEQAAVALQKVREEKGGKRGGT